MRSIRRQSPRRWILLAVLAVMYCYVLNVSDHWRMANSISRTYLTLAMLEDGTTRIDQCIARYGDTYDKARYGGHFYSDKAPGYSILLLPFAAGLRYLGITGLEDMLLGLRYLGLSLPVIAFWFAMVPVYSRVTGNESAAIAVIAAGACGSGFLVYGSTLFSHVPAGILLFLSYLAARRSRIEETDQRSTGWPRLAGALSGLACSCDFIVILALPILWVYTAWWRPFDFRAVVNFGLGLVPPVALLLSYNYFSFDHPLKTGFFYHAEAQYLAAYQSGFMGVQSLDGSALLGMTFSPARGIFFLSPVLTLAVLGWWKLFRGDDREFRLDAIVSAAIFLAIFLFAMTTVDWRGGWAVTARYLVPAIPFLLIGVAGALRNVELGSPVGVAFVGLSTVGIVLTSAALLTFPYFPEKFYNPIFSLALPELLSGHCFPNLGSSLLGPASIVPFVVAAMLAVGLIIGWHPGSSPFRVMGSGALGLVLAGLVIFWQARIAEPAEFEDWQDFSRVNLLIYMGYLEEAESLLERVDDRVTRDAQRSLGARGTQGAILSIVGLPYRVGQQAFSHDSHYSHDPGEAAQPTLVPGATSP
jgi:hypothetical protein